jgi:DnaJ family protein C protein 7
MRKKEWMLARLALDQCFQGIEGEGGEIPIEWRIWRIELELARGNWDAANTSANDALRLEPNSPDVLATRGLVLFLSGKLPQALQHVQSALRLDPGHEAAMQLRKRVKEIEKLKEEGNTAFKSGALRDAIEKYTAAIERTGNKEEEGKGGQIRAILLSNRATTLVKLGKHDEALKDTEESIALYPGNFKTLRTRARIHLHLENFESSVADFKAALEQAKFEDSVAEVRSLQTELRKAEAALKRSKTKDYYKILSVARDCTDAEIKKAYRKESLIHHPDKGGDEEKFKLVSEAFSVLSDPQRRQRYDMGEDDSEFGGGAGGGMGGMNPQDIAEIFAQFGGGMPHGFGGGGFGFHNHGGGRGAFPF